MPSVKHHILTVLVEKFAGGWTVGPTEYDFGDRTYRLNAWHQDQVVKKPETAKDKDETSAS